MSADVLFACLYQPPGADPSTKGLLAALAQDFSPRFEVHRDDLVVIDASGLGRLLGAPPQLGTELQRAAAQRRLRLHVAIAGTWTAALVLSRARPGLTVVPRGAEAGALSSIPVGLLEGVYDSAFSASNAASASNVVSVVSALKGWGINTLGALAALPPADLAARLGQAGVMWRGIARGEDVRPLVPTLEAERFESSLELEWPIEGLEPMSFVLTRLLEPLSTRLERRDRGAAVLHVVLGLVTREVVMRRVQLPAPIRDVRTLRTLALLDLESRPLPAAVDRVQVVIDPTPGRVVQHTFFSRPHPTPEQLSTLLARLNAVMGADRVGAAATVDSYRPGAFEMKAFPTEHDHQRRDREVLSGEEQRARSAVSALNPDGAVVSALRRCRQPVPARVALVAGRPARVTTDRRGFAGGAVRQCAGPWRASGNWWAEESGQPAASRQPLPSVQPWNRDEWDVALQDGAVYRIFRDRDHDAWFIDAIVD